MATQAAFIAGGTTGIGRATAELLHERGYHVAITGQNGDSVEQARRELPDDVLVLQADARFVEQIDAAVDRVRDQFGELSTLFVNAGVSRPTPLESVEEETFDDLLAVNTKGSFFTLQKSLPLLADGASVVFTVGIGATHGIAGGSVTAGSRGALLAMVPSLALELAPRGIRVNAISPGPVDTPIWGKSGAPREAVTAMKESIAERTPLGRLGSAREIAETVAFLASDGAAYITGQNIVVAGGAGLSV
jgi:NAD(P)-dependent dehydrogenase (short-subunit alcohol dehydrogenase family)